MIQDDTGRARTPKCPLGQTVDVYIKFLLFCYLACNFYLGCNYYTQVFPCFFNVCTLNKQEGQVNFVMY